ncbi:TPA: restriction endonuclease subunit S [Aeromonas dhakensis]|uniref:restriction endonuclease subunit S n=1 Tax=Aeromonas dhakensis TaxID=196024 RepID=UPI00289022E0|nr:restriction endonuclease subunit S [Aeromonas dhakensis]HDX8471234.1 restriction endonuclease subunit S [Aeromonas dhakensis]HDZ8868349.1 restriction endonuclease subunit S [Aeromonas dhakensis]HDZ8931420.1 restriction endonuclease subunit S [Aeromonas dhakensis]HDZ9147273.1 restriction endonuclease subunit S [Aeromonas dhakensis]
MDAKQFLAEFGHVAHAPEGIARLRELIYQLAVTGRLTSQDENDSNADNVLNNVARIRHQLIAEKKYKRSPKLESSNLVPPTIALPPNWRWSRLLDLGEINPRNQAEEAAMATFVPMAGVSEKHSKEISGEIKLWSEIHKGYTHFANGDVLLAKITPCFENGKAAVVSGLKNDIGAGSTEFHVFRSISQFIDPGYVYLFLRSPLFRENGKACMTGTAGQKRLPTDYFALCAMPLPPTIEQSRIVAKVDELMALCDKLEAKQQARRKLQNALRQSILQAVASATSKHELQTAWTRMTDNFGELFHAPEDVRMLRDVIFDLALRGSLLPEVTDTDLSDLLADGTTPLPRDWHWKTLAELSEYITSGSRGWKSYISNTGDSFIRSQDIKHDALIFENPAFVSLPVKAEGKRTLVRQGDLLLTITGGNVGKCAMVPVLSQDAYVSQHVALIRLRETWLAEFVHAWMINSFGGRNFLARYIYGDKPGLNLTQVGSVPVPVPTQSACVAILTKLRSYQRMCEKFERQLRVKQEVAEALALVTISSLTGIAIEQEEEPMKAPQTELIAPLRLGTTPDIKAQAPLATILARHNGEMSAKDLWQRFGGEIDAFYAQLKTEVVHGWILEPPPAEVREKPADTVSP